MTDLQRAPSGLVRGRTYRVVLAAPETGPYRGIPRRPFVGEYRGASFIGGRTFWAAEQHGSRWESAYDEEIDYVQEVDHG